MAKKGVKQKGPPKQLPRPADLKPLGTYATVILNEIAQYHASTQRKKR